MTSYELQTSDNSRFLPSGWRGHWRSLEDIGVIGGLCEERTLQRPEDGGRMRPDDKRRVHRLQRRRTLEDKDDFLGNISELRTLARPKLGGWRRRTRTFGELRSTREPENGRSREPGEYSVPRYAIGRRSRWFAYAYKRTNARHSKWVSHLCNLARAPVLALQLQKLRFMYC